MSDKTAPVLLSTSSVYPEPTAVAFELAAKLGYDGVEVMVWTDAVSQDPETLATLSGHYGVNIGAVHAPCLLMTQRVWSKDPWERLRRAAVMAERLDAPVVVIHPPFAWQRGYGRGFAAGLDRMSQRFGDIRFAVENMYPIKMARKGFVPYAPHWDPTDPGYDNYTLDLSHCAASNSDALAMAERMGDNLTHVHLGDGATPGRDEHAVPGRGGQPCAELLTSLSRKRNDFTVTVEVSTRKAGHRAVREADLAESLAFARQHLTPAAAS
ncbi:MAG TPA: sugar phosphate isomerase/epimerase [Stackebrandtia sp.]|jgi:sugar phosphate isomerase/epimerase|uniref:sugar phosphate isomerase/epimerase family protein n=1 Tax=Stackebrandtia sp. TaxID=2023065 RepID=UPI002D73F9E5|nr:sugar phosphate isomerase/epimerase [Stackebrandtia sp.]HZE41952.1 sugar phosphate isomerase/epimerase [Stackebrandtia sp.]